MKDKAIDYLMTNPLLHMGMIDPIRRGSAEILYAEIDGVLIKEQRSDAYMISVNNFEKGKELLSGISKCDLIVAHQKFMIDYIFNRFGLTEKTECVQAVYLNKTKIPIIEKVKLRQLAPKHINVILEHYDILPDDVIEKLLEHGNLFGGYKSESLIGFIGNHLEGSIGLLEIFPEYRRLGYGTELVSHMVNRTLEKDLIPFGQIIVGNEKSMAMQNKLGFKISDDKLYWIF